MGDRDDFGATRATWGQLFQMTLTRALTSIKAFWWPHVAPRCKNGRFLRFLWGRVGSARGPNWPALPGGSAKSDKSAPIEAFWELEV